MADQGLSVQVDAESFRKTMHALDLFAPDLRDKLIKTIRGEANEIKRDAAGRFPRKTGQGASAFKTRVRVRGDDVSGVVFNNTRQAQILEFAGSTSGGRTKQGQSLIQSLTEKYGPTGRFMWDAYDRADTPRDIAAAIAEADEALGDKIRRVDS